MKKNAYAVILNNKKNDKIKIIISHASKKQRVNIINKFQSTNKQNKKLC